MNFKYLNVGGGNFCQREDGWANLDFPFERFERKRNAENMDIKHDVMSDEPFPIEDESLEVVYSSHLIEHLPEANVAHMFAEAFRILVPEGVLRVSCPDADKFFDSMAGISGIPIISYVSSKGLTDEKELFFDNLFYHLIDKISPKEFRRILSLPKEKFFEDMDITVKRYPVTREMQNANPHKHISYWRFDKVKAFMETACFSSIERKERNESIHEVLKKSYIDDTAPAFSLYVEGVKL